MRYYREKRRDRKPSRYGGLEEEDSRRHSGTGNKALFDLVETLKKQVLTLQSKVSTLELKQGQMEA